ncbi:MAG: hypothetical protein L0216_07050 [Planctomycetales bacterium]|nr:hypothetical protein [Planctomycetales bacterium]
MRRPTLILAVAVLGAAGAAALGTAAARGADARALVVLEAACHEARISRESLSALREEALLEGERLRAVQSEAQRIVVKEVEDGPLGRKWRELDAEYQREIAEEQALAATVDRRGRLEIAVGSLESELASLKDEKSPPGEGRPR